MRPPPSPTTRAKKRASILPSRLGKDAKYSLRIVPASPAKPKAPSVTSGSKVSETLTLASPGKKKPGPKVKEKKPKEAKPRPPHKNKVYYRAGLWSADPLYLPSRVPSSPSRLRDLPPPPPSPSRKSTLTRVPYRYLNQFPPLPIHWGLGMMEIGKEFCLPFDVLYDWQEGGLEGKKVPGKYVKLRRNLFTDRKPFYNPEVLAICSCTPDSRCGNACLNRAMNYLCGKQCPAGERCTNQSLAAREQKEYKVVWTGNRGFGIQAAEVIHEGDFIMDYRGEIISMNTFYSRIRTVYNGRKDFYALSYDGDEVIDAGLKGNDARFINHSCAPNIEVRKYATMGMGSEEFEVGFWAMRDIAIGEELFYNYNFDSFTTIRRPPTHPDFAGEDPIEKRQKCYCGAATCSGLIGKKGSDSGSADDDDGLGSKGKKVAAGKGLKGKKKRKNSAARQIMEKLKKAKQSSLAAIKAASLAGATPDKKAKGKGKVPVAATAMDVDIISSPSKSKPAFKSLSTIVAEKQRKVRASGVKQVAPTYTPDKHKKSTSKKVEKLLASFKQSKQAKLPIALPQKKKIGRPPKVRSSDSEEVTAVPVKKRIGRPPKVKPTLPEEVAPTAEKKSARRSKAQRTEVVSDAPTFSGEADPVSSAKSPKSTKSTAKGKQSADGGSALEVSEMAAPRAKHVPQPNQVAVAVPSTATARAAPKVRPEPTLSSLASVDASSPAPLSARNDKSKGKAKSNGKTNSPISKTTQEKLLSPPRNLPDSPASDRPEISSKRGSYKIDQHRRHTKYGLLWKTDEELESERKRRKKGPKWVEEQKEAQLKMKAAVEAGLPIVSPPASPSSPHIPDQLSESSQGLTLEQAKGALLAAMAPESIEIRSVFMPDQSNLPYVQRSMADLIAASTLPDGASGSSSGIFEEPGHRHLAPPTSDAHGMTDSRSEVLGYPEEPVEGGNYLLNEPAGDYSSFPTNGAGIGGSHPFNAGSDGYGDLHHHSLGGPSDDHDQATAESFLQAAQYAMKQGKTLLGDKPAKPSQLQKAAEKAARAAAKAEKAARREQEQEGKKRRKKWILPLDDEQIEIERRKKKKGQAWLAAMKEAAAAKRAAAGMALLSSAGEASTSIGSTSSAPAHFNPDLTLSEAVEGGASQQPEGEVEEDTADLSSLSEMTELEEMEMNEDKGMLFREDSSGNQVPAKPKRNRKPRPPRRFKTTLTRMRPKLEAALEQVSPEEEAAALERERKRRKKGTVWLNAMKALAKAQRDAKEAIAAGLPPPAFELPPTSLIPSGKRRTKKAMAAGVSGSVLDPGLDAGSSGLRTGAGAGLLDSQSPAADGAAIPGLSVMPEIPAYMFPPNHGQPEDQDEEGGDHDGVIDQSLFEPLLASAAASFHDQHNQEQQDGQEERDTATTLAGAEFQSFMPQFQTDDGQSGGQFALSSFRFDNEGHFPVEQFAAAAAAAAAANAEATASGSVPENGQYPGNLGIPAFPELQLQGDAAVYTLPTFDSFGRPESPSQGSAPGLPGLSRLSPPGDASGTGDDGLSGEREKRKRGPPVKKIVSSLDEPFTDEDWENERRKRKKGFNWVQQTKAAVEEARQTASKGPGSNSSRSKGKRPDHGLGYSDDGDHIGEILPYPQQSEDQEFLLAHGAALVGSSGQEFDAEALGLGAQDRQELGLEQVHEDGGHGQGEHRDAGEEERLYHAAIYEALGDASAGGH